MARHFSAENMQKLMNDLIIKFINMNSDDRVKYIQRYSLLTSQEKVVLIQCRKYMNAEEKRVYKIEKDKLSKQIEEQSQPQ